MTPKTNLKIKINGGIQQKQKLLRRQFLALIACTRKEERAKISNLSFHL
jgi:hypothetical protein